MFDNVSPMAQRDFLTLVINEIFRSGAVDKADLPPALIQGLREGDTTPILRPEDYSGAQMGVLIEYIMKNIDWEVIDDTFGADIFFNGEDGLYTNLKDAILRKGNLKDYKKQDFHSDVDIERPYWNESVNRLIQLVCQRIDISAAIQYEKAGLLIEQQTEGNIGKMDLEHNRGAISPYDPDAQLADLRIVDIINADAGNSFTPENELYSYQEFFPTSTIFQIYINEGQTIATFTYYNVLLKEEAAELLAKIRNDQKLTYNELMSIFTEDGSLVYSAYSIVSTGKENLSQDKEYYVKIRSNSKPSQIFKIVKNPWVVPWYNIDGDTYSRVRGTDKEISALTNPENLDFTRNQSSELIHNETFLQSVHELYDQIERYKQTIADADNIYIGGEKVDYLQDVVWGNIDMDNRQKLIVGDSVETVVASSYAIPVTEIYRNGVPEEFAEYADGYFSFTYSHLVQTGDYEPIEITDEDAELYLLNLTRLTAATHFDISPENFQEYILEIETVNDYAPGIIAMAELTNDADNCDTVVLGESLHYIGKYGAVILERPYYEGIAHKLGVSLDTLLSVNFNEFAVIYAENTYRWIRLIMPQNKRKVEIEDLNRNFWVIGQTLTAISVYLFDEGGPLNDAVKRMMKEIGQLWENMLYLWAAFTLISQKKYYNRTHTEVVMLSYNEVFTSIKYDNFDSISSLSNTSISNYLNKYVKMYPDYNLAILPVIRKNNYEKNYYSQAWYPGVWIYNRNKDNPSWEIIDIALEGETGGWTFDAGAHPESLCGIQELDDKYNYIVPLTDATSLTPDEDLRYYGLIRDKISLVASIDDDFNSLTLNIDFFDVGRTLRFAPQKLLCNFHCTAVKENNQITVESVETDDYETYEYTDIGQATINIGYYQGELLSTTIDVSRLIYSIHLIDTAMLKPTTESDSFDYTDSGHAQMRTEDQAVLEKIISNFASYNRNPNNFWTQERLDAFTTGSNYYGFYNLSEHSDTRDNVKKARYDQTVTYYDSIDDWKSANERYYLTNQAITNTTILFLEGQRRCSYESTNDVSKPTEQYFPYSSDTDGLLAPVYGTTSIQSKLTGAVISLPKKDGTRVTGFYANHTTVSGRPQFVIEASPYVPENDRKDGPYQLVPGQDDVPITWAEAEALLPSDIKTQTSTGGGADSQWLVMLQNNTTEVDDTNWLVVKATYGWAGAGIPTSKEESNVVSRTNYDTYCYGVDNIDDLEYLKQIFRTKAEQIYTANPTWTVGQIAVEVKSFALANGIASYNGIAVEEKEYDIAAILHGRYAAWYIDQCRSYTLNDWNNYIRQRIENYGHTPISRSSYGLPDPQGNTFTDRCFTYLRIADSVRVYVFGPNGTYSRRGYYRNATGQWNIIVNEEDGNGNVDALRSNYYVISNDRIKWNMEKYKSKFRLLSADESVYQTTDDDPNFAQYAIAWDPSLEVWDQPSNI